jgi:two-component system sensor histidine kinase KdpD
MIGTIQEEAERLNRFIGNLLDMTRIESGSITPGTSMVDLSEIVGSALQRAGKILAGHRVEMRLPADLPMLTLDAVLFEQVLFNLLDNAAKYSPQHGAIQVSLTRDAEGVLLQVQDQGIGLPPGMTEQIFRPFGRAPNAQAANIPGLGLGLYICRQIARRHGGRLWAESDGEARGTTLCLWLPPEPLVGGEADHG